MPCPPPPPPAQRQALITQARRAMLDAGAPAQRGDHLAPQRTDGTPPLRDDGMPPLQNGMSSPLRGEVEPWIARSWQRCLSSGLRPAQRVVFDQVSAGSLRRNQEQHRQLLRAARPVLGQLARAIAAMRYFAMLIDARGIVVEVQGPCDRSDPRASAIGRVGIDLSEAAVGTTAIGAALAELQPVWLHRGEHFFDDNGSYSCAGAPLFDPQGRCVGMLDLTGIDVPERPELRHLVARTARAMEDALLLQSPHALLLRLNWPGCQLGGESDALLALDADGLVLGANSLARQLLPLPLRAPGAQTHCSAPCAPTHCKAPDVQTHGSAPGVQTYCNAPGAQTRFTAPGAPLHCSDLLALPWGQLFDAARQPRTQALELPLRSGLRLQALAQWPGATQHSRHAPDANPPANAHPPISATPEISAPPPLRQAEAAIIRKAVQDARGNVAQAARALGISRATVYRKLAAPSALTRK